MRDVIIRCHHCRRAIGVTISEIQLSGERHIRSWISRPCDCILEPDDEDRLIHEAEGKYPRRSILAA